MNINPFNQTADVRLLNDNLTDEDINRRGYLPYVLEFFDNMLEYGTDRYGEIHRDLFVSMLDIDQKECLEFPPRTTTRHTFGSFLPYAPSPYMINIYAGKNLSWGYYHSYEWGNINNSPLMKDNIAEYSFNHVEARALSLKVKIDHRKPTGIHEVLINGGRVKVLKGAATYMVEGSWSPCSIYSVGNGENESPNVSAYKMNIDALFDGRDNKRTFSFWEKQLEYDVHKYNDDLINGLPADVTLRTGTDEWIMLEFDKTEVIDKVEIIYNLNEPYALPQNIDVCLANELDYSKATYPDWQGVPWRGGKREIYTKARASDFYEDQPLMHAFEAASKYTNNDKYRNFIGKYLKEVVDISPRNEFMWGTHRFYDVYLDESNFVPERPDDVPHELAVKTPAWESLWNFDPEAVEKEIDHIRTMHIVNNETGEYNRHDVGNPAYNGGIETPPCCISLAGGQFLYAFAFLYNKTGKQMYMDSAKLLMKLYRTVEGKTKLPPDCPNLHSDNVNTQYCGSEIVGTFCYGLLKSYEVTGDEEFRDMALQYLRNFGKLAYDEKNEKFFARVNIQTGECETGARWNAGETPLGYMDLWQPYQYGFEQTIMSAQSYAYAYFLTKDPEMKAFAEKWAFAILNNLPEDGCRRDSSYELYATLYSRYGTFADHYGRCISFFLNMFINTNDSLYFAKAKEFANQAVKKLFYKGFFKGHPARDYYHNCDGVGFLMYALIQMHIAENEEILTDFISIDNY